MALYWPKARLAVSCAGANASREELPEDVLVIHVSTEEARDPDFADEVSFLLCQRLEDWKEGLVEEVRERGKEAINPLSSLGEEEGEAERELSDAEQAEKRLGERVCALMGTLEPGDACEEDETTDDDEDEDDAWTGFADAFDDGREPYGALGYGTFGYGLLDSPGINIVINHCDELFVRR